MNILRRGAAAVASVVLSDRTAKLASDLVDVCNKSGLPPVAVFAAALSVTIQSAKNHKMDRDRLLRYVTEAWDRP